MKIFLFGYGKMGKLLEENSISQGHEIAGIYDPYSEHNVFSLEVFRNADVAIDYSTPASVVSNIVRCFENNIPVVVGTTGWYDEIETLTAQAKTMNGTLLYAPNFSIGVNILFKLTEYLSNMINGLHGYDISIHETHHDQKKDAPSGTAINIANRVMENHTVLKTWATYPEGDKTKIKSSELPIYFERKGDEVGTHKTIYQSENDRIIIEHQAFNRQGFAAGTLLATAWIIGKKGVFTMSDILKK